MVRTFITNFQVSFAEKANSFIYFLRRVPLIGKKIPVDLYKATEAKIVLGALRELFGLIAGFFKKALYLGVMIALPTFLISRQSSTPLLPNFLHIFFFLSIVLGPLIRPVVFDSNQSAYTMIILMRANARNFYLSQIIFANAKDFILFILPTAVTGLIIGFSSLNALAMVISLIAARLIGEWLNLVIYDKTSKILANKIIPMTLIVGAGLGFAYILPILGYTIQFQALLFSAYGLIPLLGLGIASFIYLWQYQRFTELAKDILSKENLFNQEIITRAELNFADVKLNEKHMDKNDLGSNNFAHKQGYEYLNALFFHRHKRLLVSPIKMRVLTISLIFLFGLFLLLFFPGFKTKAAQIIPQSTPVFVFLMYVLSTGERICKAMFYNCDVSLLRYSYYRQGNVILANFTARLKYTILLNLIPASALCLALAGIVVASGYSFQLIGMMPQFLCILSLACFFSIHHLFMYYTIQPYTVELMVKSPLFKFISVVMYLACYVSLQIKTSSYYFTLGVLVTTILYMAVALAITYKVAPKTFRLR